MKTYTTSRGIKIEFLPIPRESIMRFRAANPEPQPPTYTVKSITGVEEQHTHDETTISTPEEQAAWAAYQSQRSQYTLRYLRFLGLRGVQVHATMDEWIEEQAFIGIPLPENKAERRWEWLTSFVFGDADDYKRMTIGIMEASGVPEGLLEQIEATFRGDVPGHPASQSDGNVRRLESEPGVSGSQDDVPLSADPQSVGIPEPVGPGVGT